VIYRRRWPFAASACVVHVGGKSARNWQPQQQARPHRSATGNPAANNWQQCRANSIWLLVVQRTAAKLRRKWLIMRPTSHLISSPKRLNE